MDGKLIVSRGKGEAVVMQLQGDWTMGGAPVEVGEWRRALLEPVPARRVVYVAGTLGRWDSRLLALLFQIEEVCRLLRIESGRATLPKEVLTMLEMASAVPGREGATGEGQGREGVLARVGQGAQRAWAEVLEVLEFAGESLLTLGRFLMGRARCRLSDVWLLLEDCGVRALGIVTLISFLVGLIMAYVGAAQLQKLGADIFVANLVALAMVREMGAMMTAVIMSGRTGAAFAAQLGTMKVTEEMDALRTVGLSPMEFLVLPRMLALALMMPLLTVYADFVGILGGYVAAMGMLDVSHAQYFSQTQSAVTLTAFSTGLVKSVAFGMIVAGCGCMKGLRCGSDSSAVGEAATSAVVMSITCIIVADALFTVLFNVLNI